MTKKFFVIFAFSLFMISTNINANVVAVSEEKETKALPEFIFVRKPINEHLISYSDEAFYQIKDHIIKLKDGKAVKYNQQNRQIIYRSKQEYNIYDLDDDGKEEILKIISITLPNDSEENSNIIKANETCYLTLVEQSQESDFLHKSIQLGSCQNIKSHKFITNKTFELIHFNNDSKDKNQENQLYENIDDQIRAYNQQSKPQ